jgi:hypothetical protein
MARRTRTITLPDEGPALVFIGPWRADGTRQVTVVDRDAIADRRERRLYRALTAQADDLADEADRADEPKQVPIGFTLTTDPDRAED